MIFKITNMSNANKKEILDYPKHTKWIKFSSLSDDIKPFMIPYNETKISKKYNNKSGYTKSKFIQINEKNEIKVVYKKRIEYKKEGIIKGCDIGINNIWTLDDSNCSNDYYSDKITNFGKLLEKMTKTKSNSKSFKRLETFRTNFINRSINKLKIDDCKILKIEKLSVINPSCKFLKHWTGRCILDKITRICEENNVKVLRVSPTNTSRMCNNCNYVDKKNRINKYFICLKCNYKCNADVNAAKNIKNLNVKEKIIPSDGKKYKNGWFYSR